MHDKPTYTDRLITEKVDCVILLRSRDLEGRDVFFFLLINTPRIPAFKMAMRQPQFKPADYGAIVHSGYGIPDDDDFFKMKLEYGFDKQQMVFLTQE